MLRCGEAKDKGFRAGQRKAKLKRIRNSDDIAAGLAELVARDPRLVPVAAIAGELPLRLTRPGFASLASIIISQQVSRASADAIRGRLGALIAPLSAASLLAAEEDLFRKAGLSRPKQRTLLAIAHAVENEGLDLEGLCELDAGQAMARLTAIPGIGPWTAEVYLLFAAGHPDIFPAHDVALQSAVGEGLSISPRPNARALYALAESWSPWRGVAARLFWSFYAGRRGREAAPPA